MVESFKIKGLMMRFLIVLLVAKSLMIAGTPSRGEIRITTNLETDPAKAPFVYDDVHNFIRLSGMLPPEADNTSILQAEYLDKGSVGLGMFIQKYDLTAEMLAKAIAKRPEKYAGVGELPEWLVSQEKPVREAFVKLKQLVPDVVFPPTYYLVGAYRGIGSGSPEGQLITVEKFDPEKKRLDTLIVHELVHFQQLVATGPDEFYAIFGPKKTLLALTIREGAAEFLADRTTGRITQEKARAYVLEHEEELWSRFQADMNASDTGDWMWKTPSDPDQPRHVAYMIGYRIVEAYYNRAVDKAEAMRETLSVTDYVTFLKRSGYAERFQN
jgi:hypothetical protein